MLVMRENLTGDGARRKLRRELGRKLERKLDNESARLNGARPPSQSNITVTQALINLG